ncbi:hypothetical protein N7462_007158 [Penicillium macrosclerotiorum]|uniref:uncharacterized protein n=1 Tax=Penicillium macrosclerotiorum TaxID=303699 RepID=UPI002549A7BA|nr:uncharacterized protein N7462_007158 [Penicillium macrosclerotiorum]KAJ5678914.1 hypothetical protein N7462_007158 [Penicillium macrosclerotiorum]
MTDPIRPGLQPVSHLKAGPTTSSSRSTAQPSSSQPPLSRPSSRLRAQKTSSRDEPIDGTSDKATLALIRRVLCAQANSHGSSPQPPEALLPPLTSSNDVDRQLYAIIAIIIKEFVFSWYSKITPDQALINEVLQVVAHCTRALEQRMRQIDVAQLVLDEIPALVEAHILSYRLAKQQSHLSGLPTSHRALYHELNPHPGLSPVPDRADPDTISAQTDNEAVYRQLLAGSTLAVLLPTEDLENSSLRILVRDVLSDLILGREVAGRICEGWFLWESITKATTAALRHKTSEDSNSASDTSVNRLERFGLLSEKDDSASSPKRAQSRTTAWIWNVLQGIYLGYVALRFIATGLFRVASNPGPGPGYSHGAGVSFPAATPGPLSKGGTSHHHLPMVLQLLGISHRMPWLSGLLALVQHQVLAGPGRLGDTGGVLDRFLRETIEEYVLTPTLLPNLLLVTRAAIFPANARSSPAITEITAPTLVPQVSVLPPTPRGKPTLVTDPVAHSAERTNTPVLNSNAVGKSSRAGGCSIDLTGGDPPPTTLSPESTSLTPPSPAIDSISASNNAPNPDLDGRPGPSKSEIAAIKRRCAVSLLTVVPRNVTRTFLGVPAPTMNDRTCSATTASALSHTNTSHTPPSSSEEGGGGVLRSPIQDATKSSSQTSLPTSSASASPGVSSGDTSAATPGYPDRLPSNEAPVGPDDLALLGAIETELLDLFADEYCNKHLVYAIIETVLAKILPEIRDRSPHELMEDRGPRPPCLAFAYSSVAVPALPFCNFTFLRTS